MSMTTPPSDEASGRLRDETLRRALAHAPDQASVPDWRLRKAILKMAHEAAGAVEPADQQAKTRPWWRFWGKRQDGGSARMPWNAAFATVLVACLVTVLWQREPVPGAGSAREAEVAPSVASKAPAAPQQPRPTESAPVVPAVPESPAPAAAEPAVPVAPAPAEAKRQSAAAEDRAGAAGQNRAPSASPPPPSVAAAPPPAPAPLAPAARPPAYADEPVPSEALMARARKFEEEFLARRQDLASRPPAAAMSPGGTAADAARAAAAPSARSESTEPPTFDALAQWSRITITQRGGESRSLSRAEARELNALMGSAALSAAGAAPLAGTPDWRVTLERNGETLAVFEVARSQVRWREGRAPAATGTPSAGALAALREALREAVQPPKVETSPPPSPQPPTAPLPEAAPQLEPPRNP